jgi:hypothetical protein
MAAILAVTFLMSATTFAATAAVFNHEFLQYQRSRFKMINTLITRIRSAVAIFSINYFLVFNPMLDFGHHWVAFGGYCKVF